MKKQSQTKKWFSKGLKRPKKIYIIKKPENLPEIEKFTKDNPILIKCFNQEVKISMNQNFTVGDIFRLKLLKNHSGEPYKDKATIARIVKNQLKAERKLTPWGMGWSVRGSEITKWNNQWK